MIIKKFLRLLINEVETLRYLIYHRVYIAPKLEKSIVDQFHKLYYDSHIFGKTWGNTFWLGIPIMKCPLDLWIYQEIISEVKPDVMIECGTAYGGSALFLASMCDLVNNGKVITVDIEDKKNRPQHKRIKYLLGSSTSEEIVGQVRELITNKDKVMVLLDSDHHKEHVLSELRIYSKFVTKGSYIIIEDTNINGHSAYPDFGPGPMEAVEEFLKENKNFIMDRSKEKFYLTFNPKGYLKKMK
ncbi:MAG: cephalosporin hydroxylase [Candidatus Omnitrophica bacterium 4484_213]|nr:MAG: cephalosporin hydroxylase [Candidatus Omnitrophica bacterium 4484_213]